MAPFGNEAEGGARCGKCGRRFQEGEHLMEHYIDHLGLPRKCSFCGKKIKWQNNLRLHQRTIHGTQKLKTGRPKRVNGVGRNGEGLRRLMVCLEKLPPHITGKDTEEVENVLPQHPIAEGFETGEESDTAAIEPVGRRDDEPSMSSSAVPTVCEDLDSNSLTMEEPIDEWGRSDDDVSTVSTTASTICEDIKEPTPCQKHLPYTVYEKLFPDPDRPPPPPENLGYMKDGTVIPYIPISVLMNARIRTRRHSSSSETSEVEMGKEKVNIPQQHRIKQRPRNGDAGEYPCTRCGTVLRYRRCLQRHMRSKACVPRNNNSSAT